MPFMLYFCYSTGWVTMPTVAGTSANATIIIDASADFQMNYMTVHVKQADVTIANYGGTIQVEDSGRGRNFYNTAIPIEAVAGIGQLPYPFNPPRLARRNSSLTITLTTNVITATFVNVVFHGNKLFEEDPSGLTERALA